MKICPKCGNEYSGPESICPRCQLTTDEQADFVEEDYADSGPALLCKTGDMAGAELLAETLRQEGIPAVLNPGVLEFRMMPLEYGQKGIRIYVPRAAMEKARELGRLILADYSEAKETDE